MTARTHIVYPIERIRQEFKPLGTRIYLDLCARCPLPVSTVAAVSRYFETCMAEGARKSEWLEHVEVVRGRVARLLHATPDEIAFVKATSEGVNAFAHSLRLASGDNVVLCPDVEHPNNLYPWLHLRNSGVEIRFAGAHNGQLTASEVRRLADRHTRVVIAPHVSFKTGARADLRTVSEAAHAVGALLFVDAAQSAGVMDIDVRTEGIDAMAACVHKGLLSPYGLGLLYCRRELVTTLTPAYMGRAGVDLEDKREYVTGDLADVQLVPTAQRFEFGSYNFPAIYALGASLELLEAWNVAAVEAHVLSLSKRLTEALRVAGFDLASPVGDAGRSHIVCVRRDDANELELELDRRNIRVSARLGILRAAVGPFTTTDEVDRFVEVLAGIAPR